MLPNLDQLLVRVDRCSTQAQDISAQFSELREQIRQAISIAQLDPEMSLTRARKVLEYIVRDVYDDSLKPKRAGTQPLEGLVQALVKEGHFPTRLAAYADMVRGLGNVGTHGFDKGVSSQDVLNSLSNLMPIVEWFFEHRNPLGTLAADQARASAIGAAPVVAAAGTASAAHGPAAATVIATTMFPAGARRTAWQRLRAARWPGIAFAGMALVGVAWLVIRAASSSHHETPPPRGQPAGETASAEPVVQAPAPEHPAPSSVPAIAPAPIPRAVDTTPAPIARTDGKAPTDTEVLSLIGGRIGPLFARFRAPRRAAMRRAPSPAQDAVLMWYDQFEIEVDGLQTVTTIYLNFSDWSTPIHGIITGATQDDVHQALGPPAATGALRTELTETWNLKDPECSFTVYYRSRGSVNGHTRYVDSLVVKAK